MNTYFQLISGKVDQQSGSISGVSVITEGLAKGHKKTVDAITLEQVKAAADQMSGGVKVKVNHGTGFENIVGNLKNFRIEGQQLRADMQLVKSHDLYGQIIELAANQPETFGLSISFSGEHEKIEGTVFARCDELYSVDLVDAPAANPSGLFSVDSAPKDMADNLKEFFSEAVEYFKSSKASSEATAASEALAKLKTDFAQATADLATAKQTIESLGKKITEAEAAHKTALEAKTAEVETLATTKAQEICVKMGIPAVRVEKLGNTKASGDLVAQFDAIKDPAERTAWYRKNKAAYDAAFRELNPARTTI